MPPTNDTNTPPQAPPPAEPKKQGFFGKLAGMFKKKPAAAPVVPAGFTSQTPEPRLDNLPGEAAAPADLPTLQAAPLADVALSQTTTLAAPTAPAVVDPPAVPPVAPVAPAPVMQQPVAPQPQAIAPAPATAPVQAAGAQPNPFAVPAPTAPTVPPQPPQQPPAPGV